MSARDLIPFHFEGRDIRVVHLDGEPMLVAKDVAEALGYVWNGAAAISHVPDEWKGVSSVLTPRGIQQMAVLTEQGLYFFLGRSDKPKALPFQKWVAGEVIPAIRMTGRYAMPELSADPLAGLSIENRALVNLMCEQAAIRTEQTALARTQAIQHETLLRIESNQIAAVASVQSFTALGYSISISTPMSQVELTKLGKKASAISQKRGLTVDKVKDGRYGFVGSYHVTALDAAYEDLCK